MKTGAMKSQVAKSRQKVTQPVAGEQSLPVTPPKRGSNRLSSKDYHAA
jgi:hypothetical protein